MVIQNNLQNIVYKKKGEPNKQKKYPASWLDQDWGKVYFRVSSLQARA